MTLPIIDQIIIILCITVLAAALLHRFKIPTIIHYLAIGLIAGPQVTGIVTDVESYSFVAEFGVAFLLFTLGLEFSLPRLFALRKTVFGMGSLQMLICLGSFSVLIYLYGVSLEGTLIAASAIALSSTAIVTKELASVNQVNTRHGQIAIGILLFQDIAAVVLLVFITASTQESDNSVWFTLFTTLLKGIAYFLSLVLIGKYLLPPLFHQISNTRSEELFVLTTLTVAISAAGLAHALGLAMALGAFMAGMMLGESHFKHQIENEIRPFRDVLLGLFFVTIGFMLDVDLITQYWPRILFFAACLIVFKAAIITALCLYLGDKKINSLRAGIVLSQGGEFGFALIAIGLKGDLIPADVASFFVSVIVLSMAATPFLVKNISAISDRLLGKSLQVKDPSLELSQAPSDDAHQPLENHVIILGYGRVGQMISRFLRQENITCIAIDDDSVRVQAARQAGENVYFGNAKQPTLLKLLGLNKASLVVLSFDDYQASKMVASIIREVSTSIPIIARLRDDGHAQELVEAGVTEVIPEVNEATMMIISHVMAALHVPAERVEALLQNARDERYQMLKGYFLGKKVREVAVRDSTRPVLQPVYIPQGAWVVDHALAELNLAKYDVDLQVVRREHQTLTPPYDQLSVAQADIMVLHGLPADVEAAESYLLTGVA
ncbi:MAG: cation:proton antiporter [Hahellaceae bacterium]|nr:cation:proton antiporter [Hahellaceae bacterium]MCP5210292.1 cation:proton antiporter [Hahellaceae bacterium]